MTTNLTGKRIVLGVTGSIAAYKAATIASHLTKLGAQVDAILTRSALEFITPLTFSSLTGRPAYTSMWHTDASGGMATHIAHVGLAHHADLLLIAPITANSIAKLALGLSDDLLSVTALAVHCPIVIAPAMDAGMFHNAATQTHVEALQARGVVFAGPAVGRMASGFEGLGRMLDPDAIIGVCRRTLGAASGPLRGRRVVITAGPTREPLDPVRFLSNRSSGRQGFALAQAAIDAGAAVTLISGPVDLPTPTGVERIDVTTTREMRDAVLEKATGPHQCDVLIMAAAVSDFRPEAQSEHKIKKAGGPPTLQLAQNPDILQETREQATRPRLVIGFAAESENVVANAQSKLARKGLDLIVANDITALDAGFTVETNRVQLITAQAVEELPLLTKAEVANRVIAWAADRLS